MKISLGMVSEKLVQCKRTMMATLGQQPGRYRVLLLGIGNNTEAEKDSFCYSLSNNYNVPFPQLRRIVERCPVILKKDLSLKKAELLANTFKSFGALVSVEEKREIPPIVVEFQELSPHRLVLESCFIQKSTIGTWSVTGRAKNISDETLSDTWVLVQVFEDFEEFVAFEESPLPVNPLPSGQASPFKVVFDGPFSFKKISVGFKNASGRPVPARDRRKKTEWAKVDGGKENGHSSPGMPAESEEKPAVPQWVGPVEKMLVNKGDETPGNSLPPPEQEVAPPVEYGKSEDYGNAEKVLRKPLSLPFEPLEKALEPPLISVKEDDSLRGQEVEKPSGPGTSGGWLIPGAEKLGEEESASDEKKGAEEARLDSSVFQEDARLPQNISEKTEVGEAEERKEPSFPWMEYFRDAVKTFYQTPHGAFPTWFEECRKKGEFKNSLHGLLTILLHCRFDQGSQSFNPLQNTRKLFRLAIQSNLVPEEIPGLEGTSFASDEIWRDLFIRALPKLRQIGKVILEKSRWSVLDLERLIQVIPQMGIQNSRRAIQWIDELLPDIGEIDFSDTPIIIGKDLYRVSARLGILDPDRDSYHGKNSVGDARIQSFAIMAFPHHPARIEKPMMWMGGGEEQGGHCFPVHPWCDGCLFKTFCPRLYLDFDPSEIGMRS